jgi:hypothetical protein
VTLYYSLLNIFKKTHEFNLNTHTGFVMVVTGTYLIFLVIIIYKSVDCMTEISKTSSIINKIANSKIGKESRKVIKTFSQQILQRQRSIRSGFFEVNWNLLQKVRMSFQTFTELLITELFLQILSSTLAFLIITYQFGQNAD